MSKVYNIKGIELACASSNTRYGKRNDSLVITLDEKSTISGKFTSNSFKAAPIKVALKNLTSLVPGRKALLINAGNANAATGLKGLKDDNLWIYIERTQTRGKLLKLGRNYLKKNNVLILEFSNLGILESKEFYDKEKMKKVKFSKATTDNEIMKENFIYSFLSSIRQKMRVKQK